MTELGTPLSQKAQRAGHEVEGSEFNVLIVGQNENDVRFTFPCLPNDVIDGRVLRENSLDDTTLLDPPTSIVRSTCSPIGRPSVMTFPIVMTSSLLVRVMLIVSTGMVIAMR